MSLGIDPKRVYADDGDANPAFWTVFPGHVHGQVVKALKQDTAVLVAIQAKLQAPNDVHKRGAVVDLINRATANCLGQRIVHQTLHPDSANFTIYNLLSQGTAAAIDEVISAPQNKALHDAFAMEAQKAPDQIISVVSRQTGRALFQTCLTQLIDQAVNPGNLVSKLEVALLKAAEGIVPGIP